MGQVTLACRRYANICRASELTSKGMSPPGQGWSKHLGLSSEQVRTKVDAPWGPDASQLGGTEAHLPLTPPHELHPADGHWVTVISISWPVNETLGDWNVVSLH